MLCRGLEIRIPAIISMCWSCPKKEKEKKGSRNRKKEKKNTEPSKF